MFYIIQLFKKMSNRLEATINDLIEDHDTCCVCRKMPGKFLPIQCYKKAECTSHKICENCWWDEETGFASEMGSHKCPGCIVRKST